MRPAYTFLTVVSLVLLLFAGVAQVSWAGDYQVDDFGDAFDDVPGDGNCATEDDTCTLRAAIQEASATPLTDNVTFSGGGTIFLTLGALSVQDDMTIFNGSPASVTVDGGGGNSIFVIGSSIDNDLVVTIEGLTLTNAGGASSSAIQIATDAGSTRIEDCVVTGNNITAGAIQAQGNVLILETEITGNTSSTNGAGLQIPSVKSPHTVTIRGVLIEDNISNSDGGGISTSGSLLTIQNSEIRGNMALDSGGGIHLIEGEMSISNSQIIDNSITGSGPTASGGGIWFTALAGVWNGLAIGDSTIAENEAPNSGGGIYFSSNHPFLMTNSTISENVTGARGGGIYYTQPSDSGQIGNSTISSNESAIDGAGIHVEIGDLTLFNTTVYANLGTQVDNGSGVTPYITLSNSIVASAPNPAGLQGQGPIPLACDGAITVLDPNLDHDGSCGVSITADPDLDPLQNNGGLTATHLPGEDSQAIDNGDNAVCMQAPVNGIDQRGFPRPEGIFCDLGSVEAGASIIFVDGFETGDVSAWSTFVP